MDTIVQRVVGLLSSFFLCVASCFGVTVDPICDVIVRGSIPLPAEARGLTFGPADLLFVPCGAAGVAVVDYSDPDTPILLTTIDTPGEAEHVALSGSVMIVADGESVEIYDIADLFSPTSVRSVPEAANEVLVYDGTLYAHGGGTLKAISFDDPANAALLGLVSMGAGDLHEFQGKLHVGGKEIDTSDVAGLVPAELLGGVESQAIAKHGRYLYFSKDGGSRLVTLEVVDLLAVGGPAVVGSITTQFSDETVARRLVVRDGYVYAAMSRNGLVIYDVQDPTLPSVAGHLEVQWGLHDVVLRGNFAYLAQGVDGAFGNTPGVVVANVGIPTNPYVVGKLEDGYVLQQAPHTVAIYGDTLYAGDLEGRVVVADLSAGVVPTFTAAVDQPFSLFKPFAYMTAQDDLLFFGSEVYNLSVPAQPVLLSTIAGLNGVVVKDNQYLHGNTTISLSFSSGGEHLIYDLSDPANPVLVSQIPLRGMGVVVEAGVAWVSGSSLYEMSLEDLGGGPRISRSYPWTVDSSSRIVGSRLYEGEGVLGAFVYDVSDLESPSLLGRVDSPDTIDGFDSLTDVSGVRAEGALAVMNRNGQAEVLDVSRPELPVVISSLGGPGLGSHFEYRDGLVYTASTSFGVLDPGACESVPAWADLDSNGVYDALEIVSGESPDRNFNAIPDSVDVAMGRETDADLDGVIDSAEEGAPIRVFRGLTGEIIPNPGYFSVEGGRDWADVGDVVLFDRLPNSQGLEIVTMLDRSFHDGNPNDFSQFGYYEPMYDEMAFVNLGELSDPASDPVSATTVDFSSLTQFSDFDFSIYCDESYAVLEWMKPFGPIGPEGLSGIAMRTNQGIRIFEQRADGSLYEDIASDTPIGIGVPVACSTWEIGFGSTSAVFSSADDGYFSINSITNNASMPSKVNYESISTRLGTGGDGSGGYQGTDAYESTGVVLTAMSVADLNNDNPAGADDLVAVSAESATLDVRFYQSTQFSPVDGTTPAGLVWKSAEVAPVQISIGGEPIGVHAGDFTGDGVPDAMVLDRASGSLRLFAGEVVVAPTPPDEWQATQVITVSLVGTPAQMVCEDLDLDGDLDVVVLSSDAEGMPIVQALMNTGVGRLVNRELISVGRDPGTMSVGDVLGDDRPEIVLHSRGSQPNGGVVVMTQAMSDFQECASDLDGDGIVGSSDLAIVIASWSQTLPIADIDADGAVGSSDLASLVAAWGLCP